LLGLGQTCVERIDHRLLVVVLLLFLRERLRRFAQVNLALNDAVRRLLVETARDESATVDQLALAGGNREKCESRIGPPEIEEGVQVVRDVAGAEQRRSGMIRRHVTEAVDRGLQERGKFGTGAIRTGCATLGDIQNSTTDLLLLELCE